jgi:hypothetical protein
VPSAARLSAAVAWDLVSHLSVDLTRVQEGVPLEPDPVTSKFYRPCPHQPPQSWAHSTSHLSFRGVWRFRTVGLAFGPKGFRENVNNWIQPH